MEQKYRPTESPQIGGRLVLSGYIKKRLRSARSRRSVQQDSLSRRTREPERVITVRMFLLPGKPTSQAQVIADILHDRVTRESTPKINNGTASLLQLACGPVAVTCHHVIEGFRKRLRNRERCSFQIGGCRIDPLGQCISENVDLDVAVLKLTDEQVARILERDGWIGSQVFSPASWPPARVASGQEIVLGGFPGQWREAVSHDTLEFASYSQGALVSDVAVNSFICECPQSSWLGTSGKRQAGSL